MKSIYNFDHIIDTNLVPRALTVAFDLRHSAMTTNQMKFLDGYFSDEYIAKFRTQARVTRVTYYWQQYSRIHWTKKDDSHFVSKVEVMKAKVGSQIKTIGWEIEEEWTVENNKISDVKEI